MKNRMNEKKEKRMTNRDVFSIGLKIVGLMIVMQVVLFLPMLAGSMALEQSATLTFSKNIHVIVLTSYFLLLILFCVILLRWSDKIAILLIKDEKKFSAFDDPQKNNTILFLAFKIIGVYFLATGIPEVAKLIGFHISFGNFSDLNRMWAEILKCIGLLGVGLVLVLKTKKIRMLVTKNDENLEG